MTSESYNTYRAAVPMSADEAAEHAEQVSQAVFDAVLPLVGSNDTANELAAAAYRTAFFRARNPRVRLG